MSRRKMKPEALSSDQRDAIYRAQLATWEKLLTLLEVTRLRVDDLIDGVLDGHDSNHVMDCFEDARFRVLNARPRLDQLPT